MLTSTPKKKELIIKFTMTESHHPVHTVAYCLKQDYPGNHATYLINDDA